MALSAKYDEKTDYLMLSNGRLWDAGTAVAGGLIVFDDDERNIAYVELEGKGALLRALLYDGLPALSTEKSNLPSDRPSEVDLDRHGLPLIVQYDPDSDVLKLENGLPTPYAQIVDSGLTVFFDGEDEHGRFYNGVMLENAAAFLRPHLCPERESSHPPPSGTTPRR